ncbi:hypothetical protein L3X38_003085 [Prunus dulcis]|uniref:Uncharacterized protein n=1 Tax=Prunus dulcis TaxID=3755 RepID=A0AAD4WYI2_PRUDU|nr:hypothetical protein L3X38_003085 [Prunus dulcis]
MTRALSFSNSSQVLPPDAAVSPETGEEAAGVVRTSPPSISLLRPPIRTSELLLPLSAIPPFSHSHGVTPQFKGTFYLAFMESIGSFDPIDPTVGLSLHPYTPYQKFTSIKREQRLHRNTNMEDANKVLD